MGDEGGASGEVAKLQISQEDKDEIMADLWPRETKAEIAYEVRNCNQSTRI